MADHASLKDWIPFFSSLVTPVFVIALIVWFKSDVGDFLNIIKRAVGEQERSLEIGDWIKIGERARTTEISTLNLGDISISLAEHDYEEWVIDKGDESLIEKLRQESEVHGGRPVDVMILKRGIRYSSEVLQKYVNLLGVKYILFMGDGEFEAWIPTGLFLGQLHQRQTYPYDALKQEIIGLRQDSALPTASASDVLMLMQQKKTDSLAIVSSDGNYLFMVNKQDILAKLVAAMILSNQDTI